MRILLVSLVIFATSCGAGSSMLLDGPLQVQLVELDEHRVVAELTADEVRRVKEILSRLEASDGWAMTPPPWDAVLLLRAEDGRERVLQLTAATLRENTEDSWNTVLYGPDGTPSADVQDYDLDFEDEQWLWALFGRHLGETKVKQYRTIDDPNFPKL